MKYVALALLLAGFAAITFTTDVYAAGDKVRGERGQGGVHQVQVNNPPPFANVGE